MIYLFHSKGFLIFFMAVFWIYWLLPRKFKNIALLVASYVFYMSWNWKFLGLILISTYVDYFCGLKIHSHSNGNARKFFLVVSIITNLSLLGIFKYYNFFVDNLSLLLNTLGININITTLNIILPIGISFYTFQTLSYTIDIYRRKFAPIRNIIDFSLFVAYFPQLIAGPIERARNLIPKIQAPKKLQSINFKEGAYLFVYGLFKKVVIADSVAVIVDKIYAMPSPSGSLVLLATYAFAVQIYCDFSGYSNMARGISHFLGIRLSTNFNLPYFSSSPSEFWKRWHITLSSWVRDYIYIPLGGKRTIFLGFFSLLLTMSLMGLWHGAAWHFVLWGVFWFLLGYIYRLIKLKMRLPRHWVLKLISIIFMFHLTCYSWIIFRSQTISQIWEFTRAIFSSTIISELFNGSYLFFYAIIVFLVIYETILYLHNDQLWIIRKNFYIQMIFYLVLFFMYINIGAVSDVAFVYFQF